MKVLVFLLSLLVFAGAAASFGREYEAALFARLPGESAFRALAEGAGPAALPRSSRGMRDVFATCGGVQQSLNYVLTTDEIRQAVDTACAALARAALVRNPTYGAAHTILMMSETEPARIAQALVQAQLTAPREAWEAKLRLGRGLALQGLSDAAAVAPAVNGAVARAVDRAVAEDIGFLAQTAPGRAWLAGLYRADRAGRAVIVQIMETRPAAEKAAFLREVQALGQD